MPWSSRVTDEEDEQVDAVCVDCGADFVAKGTWQRRCWDCWRASKDGARRANGPDREANARAEGRAAGYDAGYRKGLEDGKKLAKAGHGLHFDRAFLFDAIRLCHPDHQPLERFAMANAVTAKLLAALEAIKRSEA